MMHVPPIEVVQPEQLELLFSSSAGPCICMALCHEESASSTTVLLGHHHCSDGHLLRKPATGQRPTLGWEDTPGAQKGRESEAASDTKWMHDVSKTGTQLAFSEASSKRNLGFPELP